MIDWTKIIHFKPEEFERPEIMSPRLIEMLDKTREIAKVSMTITSSYRAISSSGESAHMPNAQGLWEAVDVRLANSTARFKILKAALQVGFRRIGVYDQHIHLDVAQGAFAQDVMWIGESK